MARRRSSVPRPLQPLLGGALLVGVVRAIDAVWTRTTGRRPPLPMDGPEPIDDAAPGVVRDRLVYALLLGGALRLAKRVGLKDAEGDEDPGDA
jgi:hypothetical protein